MMVAVAAGVLVQRHTLMIGRLLDWNHMRLAERLPNQGRRLFTFRSIVPLTLLPLVALALPQSRAAEQWLGVTGNLVFQWAAICVGLVGLTLRCLTVAYAPAGSSSRDTHQLRATALNTSGTYSIVRHPLYLGAGLLWVGAVLSVRVWWLAAVVSLLYWVYIERVMMAEESYLSTTFGEAFTKWAESTPAFIPRFSQWRPSTGTWQWKRVLSEHNALLALASCVTLFEFLEDAQHGGETWKGWYSEHPDLVWFWLLALSISTIAIIIRRWPSNSPQGELAPSRR